jgi:AcrR family transcriptional regulator
VAKDAICPAPYFSEFVKGRRGEILDAALAVFQEKGYAGGTMRDVANRLGVTEPALYRHYAGKEALYSDMLGLAGDRATENVSARIADIRPENLRESLMSLIAHGPKHSAKGGGMMGTLIASAPHNHALMETFRERLARPMVGGFHQFVRRVDGFFGIERSPAQLESAVRVFISLFVGYVATSKVLALPDDDDAVVDAILLVMGWTGAESARG